MNKILFASFLSLSLGLAAPSAFSGPKAAHKGKDAKAAKCACSEGCEHKGKGQKCDKCACKGEECGKGASCNHDQGKAGGHVEGHDHAHPEHSPAPKSP